MVPFDSVSKIHMPDVFQIISRIKEVVIRRPKPVFDPTEALMARFTF